MDTNEIVKLMRSVSKDYENKEISLPIEIVNLINGNQQEKSWGKISIGKVMYYFADMLEE